MAKITTTDLVNKIFSFCEAYSGVKFFPYQAQFSKRIIRSLLENDGDEITALFSRQSGKSETVATTSGGCAIILPILANMPMFANDKRFTKFKTGLMIGIFAPTLNQAQISFNRMKKRMYSDNSQAVLADPEVGLTFDISNGQNIILSHNSLIRCQSASEGSNIEGDSYMLIIIDESQDVGNFKYLKSISPMGAFYNATKVLIGTPTTCKGFFYESIDRNKEDRAKGGKRNHFEYDYRTVTKYNPNYAKYIEGEKKRLGEDSDEFQMAYCLKWILERGMFITSKKFDSLGDPTREWTSVERGRTCVVGIDLGKKHDSTIVSVGAVDFEHPVIVEKSQDPNDEDFIAYDIELINLIEFQGDDWEEQYYDIIEELKNYNVVRLVIDATGVGSPIADRLIANTDYEVVPYVYSRPSKSDLYKHFDGEIKGGRFTYPASESAKESRIFKKMESQFLDLEKGYSGQYLVVAHPQVQGAHDDIPDACALMAWGAKGDPVSKPVTEKEPMYQKSNGIYNKSRNKLTARRRR